MRCKMYCKNGFEKDTNGCEICKCKGEKFLFLFNFIKIDSKVFIFQNILDFLLIFYFVKKYTIHIIFLFLDKCPPQCRMYCKFGFEKNARGCEICKCKGTLHADLISQIGHKIAAFDYGLIKYFLLGSNFARVQIMNLLIFTVRT